MIALTGLLPGCAGSQADDSRLSPMTVMAQDNAPLGESEARWPREEWWRAYGSAELDRLVAEAQRANMDLAMALGRIEQARGRARSAGALLLPAVGFDASAQRSDGSSAVVMERRGAQLSFAYEADLWGRYRAGRNAARFSLIASRLDHEAARLMVIGDVARHYAALMTVRERQAIGRLNLEAARRLLARVEAMDRLGLALAGDLAAQRALVAGEEADLAALGQAEGEYLAALALLAGQPARSFAVAGYGLAAMARLPAVSPGLPSELLLRRPDIASAEATLAAASADVRAARAAMLPGISLTAARGVEGGTGPSAAFYNLLAGLTQPILDHGRLAGERDTAEGVRIEREGAYRKTILLALSEVERDLKAMESLERSIAALESQVREASRAADAAEARYRAGVDEIIASLDAQRTLYAARGRLAQAQGDRLAASISLQQGLGGGWIHQETNRQSPPSTGR
ncbi:efflux transporter outer membrane subunit [Sphingobium cloacae]|uniref:efflux transporter outer membrane subunit n=1 Tax=Sphingobium cloacae TaxID=120107 RepID=UPI0008324F30|nr:efflux transporter outer membrane subunit [Sphingobium cloacae]